VRYVLGKKAKLSVKFDRFRNLKLSNCAGVARRSFWKSVPAQNYSW